MIGYVNIYSFHRGMFWWIFFFFPFIYRILSKNKHVTIYSLRKQPALKRLSQASLAKWASPAKWAGLTYINRLPQVWFCSRNEQLQTDIKCALSIQAIYGPLLFLKNTLQWCKSLCYSDIITSTDHWMVSWVTPL